MKKLLFFLLILFAAAQMKAQPVTCIFKEPIITINFGAGQVPDLNTEDPSDYRRVRTYCPTDGHYAYVPYTSDCFRGDWLTITEDHTPGDADGNMMLVNASPYSGAFLKTTIIGLQSSLTYEFSVWMMNVCRPTDKCPFPLLPQITILLQTPSGKTVAQISTGELARAEELHWTRYQALFTAPVAESSLLLTMIDNSPGGCGNDFVLDDISFRECVKVKPVIPPVPKAPPVAKKKTIPPKTPPVVKQPPVIAKAPPVVKQPPVVKEPPVVVKAPPVVKEPPVVVKAPPVVKEPPVGTKAPPVVKQQPVAVKPAPKKQPPAPEKKQPPASEVAKPQPTLHTDTVREIKPRPPVFPPPPPLLTTRSNPLIKQIEAEAGEITFKLYDNGTIDGDTVTVYHNNTLIVAHARLSETPITFSIKIDPEHPHHELVMVADNLGSIPPNTSLMVVTTGSKRYEVYISSTEQKNAKVIIDLKE